MTANPAAHVTTDAATATALNTLRRKPIAEARARPLRCGLDDRLLGA